MCGRYTIATSGEELAKELEAELAPGVELRPRFNLPPTDPAPIVLPAGHGRQIVLARFGFVPASAASPKEAGARWINARSELLDKNSVFAGAARTHRCLVAADGFYEWQRVEKAKRAFHFRALAGGVMTFAGLWSEWRPKDGGAPVTSFAIVTAPADEVLRGIHDRQPLVVAPELRGAWLDPGREDVRALVREVRAVHVPLEGWEVSSAVGSVKNEGPELRAPLDDQRLRG